MDVTEIKTFVATTLASDKWRQIVREFVASGQKPQRGVFWKVEAIKALRTAYGANLKDAKEIVEWYADNLTVGEPVDTMGLTVVKIPNGGTLTISAPDAAGICRITETKDLRPMHQAELYQFIAEYSATVYRGPTA